MVRLLSDCLETAVRLNAPGEEPPDDASTLWRPAIEDSDQNSPVKRVTDVLIEGLRDVAGEYIDSDPVKLREVVAALDERPWAIFRRLACHLLAANLDIGWPLARARAFDSSYFDDLNVYHEFWLLARAVAARLRPEEQLELVAAVEDRLDNRNSDDPSRNNEARLLRRLAILRDVLGPPAREHYDELSAKLGFQPDHPEFLAYTAGGWTGETSPRKASDLVQMTVSEIVGFLRDWRASGEFMSPSPEGLSQSFSTAVASEPARFADEAGALTDLHPVYMRGLIDGWAAAIREDHEFDWAPVLELCRRFLAQQPGRSTSDSDIGEADQRRWTRQSITYLFLGGFGQGVCEIPITLRNAVWAILEPLTRDADPTPEREEQYESSDMGPADLAINTTRGQAMHDVVRYALWVVRATVPGNHRKGLPGGFELMPEVRDILDERLNVTIEPSPAVRSVYGQWLSWLHWLNPEWVKQKLDAIFPEDPDLAHLRDAAWTAYLFFSQIDDGLFILLRDEYAKAVGRIQMSQATRPARPWTPDARLAQHLILQYLRGKLALTDPLLNDFFSRSGPPLRREALAHVARVVEKLAGNEPAVVDRAIELWYKRMAAVNDDDGQELTAFGWWFTAAAFPVGWILDELSKALTVTQGKIDHDFTVIRKLAEIANNDPKQAVRCLSLMTSADRENSLLLASYDAVQAILATALASDQPEVRTAAVNLVHALGAKGYTGLRSLLSPSSG